MITQLKKYPLLWLIPLYILWQFTHILLLRPDYLMGYPEELYRGTMSLELLTGLAGPFLSYLPDNYAGGSIIIALLSAFYFKIIGPTLLAAKMVPLTIFSLALIFWYLTLSKNVNTKTALIFALLYIFPPVNFMLFIAHHHMGDHPETILFTGMAIYYLFEIIRVEKPSLVHISVLGLICGFGIWFAYIFSLLVLTLFIFLALFYRRFLFSKKALVLLTFIGIGFFPWIMTTHFLETSELTVQGQPIIALFNFSNLLEIFTHFKNSVPFRFLTSFGVPDVTLFWRWKIANLLYLLLFFLPIFAFVIQKLNSRKKSKRNNFFTFFILYSFIFVSFSQCSQFRGMRFMIPLYPILFFFVAYCLNFISNKDSLQKISNFILISLLSLGIFTNASMFSLAHAGSVHWIKGYTYFYLSAPPNYAYKALCKTTTKCLNVYQHFNDKLSEEDMHAFKTGLGIRLASEVDQSNLRASYNKRNKQLPKSIEKYFYYYLGQQTYDFYENFDQAQASITFLKGTPHYSILQSGIFDARGYGTERKFNPKEFTRESLSINIEELPLYWRTTAEQLINFQYEENNLFEIEDFIKKSIEFIPKEMHGRFIEGIGAGLFRHRVENNTPKDLTLITELPETWQEFLLKGASRVLENAECIDSYPVVRDAIYNELPKNSQNQLKRHRLEFIRSFNA